MEENNLEIGNKFTVDVDSINGTLADIFDTLKLLKINNIDSIQFVPGNIIYVPIE